MKLPAQPNQSLMEGLEVLLALARRGEATGVRELAREMGMTPTRLQRYVGTLAYLGLAAQDEQRKYRPGPGIHALSAITLSASGLARNAMEMLPPLSDWGVTVALGVLWRKTVSYLYFRAPGSTPAQALGKTQDWPALDSVIGHVLLAEKPAFWIQDHFPEAATALADQLAHVRNCGYARIARSDMEISLGVPVGHPAIAGLAITGHPERIFEDEFVATLKQCAASLAAST